MLTILAAVEGDAPGTPAAAGDDTTLAAWTAYAASLLPWLLLGAGGCILAVIAWKTLAGRDWRGAGSGKGGFDTGREAGEDSALAAHALAADLRELADGIAERLDKQAARLEELIADAEQRIARLERLTGSERPIVIPPGSPARRPEALAAFPYDGDDGVPRGIDIHGHNADDQTMNEENGGGAGGAISREIYRLADEGLPSVEIAKRLNQHTGKVELILALRNP